MVSSLRWRRLPTSELLTDERRAYAAAKWAELRFVGDVDAELEAFRDYEFRDPKSDASAAWRRWVRNAPVMAGRDGTTAGPAFDEAKKRRAEAWVQRTRREQEAKNRG